MGRIRYQEAAGLKLKRGRPRTPGPDPGELRRLYEVEGKSMRDLAAIFRISDSKVRRELRAAGAESRPNVKRSRLRHLDQAALFSDLRELGPGRTAEKWGIPRRTFFDYLARIRPRDSKVTK